MNVSELWGDAINEINERSFRLVKYRKHKVKYYYYIADWNGEKYMFIMIPDDFVPPKYIKIEGIFEDPTTVDSLACADGECPNPLGTGFPVDLVKESAMFKMAFDHVMQAKKLPEDRTNNAESTIKNQQI